MKSQAQQKRAQGKIWENGPKWDLFGVLFFSFMKIPLGIPNLDQKEKNCFWHPQFHSSIVENVPLYSSLNVKACNSNMHIKEAQFLLFRLKKLAFSLEL